jgi:serine/threonine protein kinase
MFEGIHRLHIYGYAHRDIKPQNLLWKNNLVKVADFGVCKKVSEVITKIGTDEYTAPEILERDAD